MKAKGYKELILLAVDKYWSADDELINGIASALAEGDELRQVLQNAGWRVTGQPPIPIVKDLIQKHEALSASK